MAASRKATPLGVVGVVLAIAVGIDAVAGLWSLTLGANFMWYLCALMGALALFVLWVTYLVTWVTRRRRWAWHLLVIPLIGVVTIAIAATGLPQKARWSYDEPRLTEAGETFLADSRRNFHDSEVRHIGSQEVYAVEKDDGVITLYCHNIAFISIGTLEYRPDGSTPALGGEIRVERLSPHWWKVLID